MTIQNYKIGIEKNKANFAPLTPVSFLERTANIFPDYTSIISENNRFTWKSTFTRCKLFASSLKKKNIKKGDTVSIMAPNTNAMYEAHFAIPMIGAVINTINIRLDPKTISFILTHSDSKIIFSDTEFLPTIKEAFKIGKHKIPIIFINDCKDFSSNFDGDESYEDFLNEGNLEDFKFDQIIEDEWFPISLCYTSGTTGNPKGVVTHHRGAYLNAISNHLIWNMKKNPIYLWTLPMFHCNGWCFPWTITMLGGTHVCLRKVTAKNIYDSIADHGVTHLCGAPVVMNMICNAPEEERREMPHTVEIMTAAAPPPPTVIARMEEAGFNVTHVYGLTEVYGPAVVCQWQEAWSEKDKTAQAQLKGRQGVRYHMLEGLMVADPETLEPVPDDGETMGEVLMKGNIVMKGYLKNPEGTEHAFAGGWFHSGDLGVLHPDGYIELKDRSKDIIISGGENISSVEIENVLYQHPDILEAAVVARPDDKWGETPCAFVVLKSNVSIQEKEVIEFCRSKLAGFKVPKKVVFSELPKTSTGKIRKSVLREQAKQL